MKSLKTTSTNCDSCDSFLVIFKKARKQSHNYIESRIKEYNLTSNQIDVLIFLHRHEKFNTAKDIVEYIGVSKGLVSRSVDDLIKKNYLFVEEDERDRRKLRLFLTDSGKDIVKKIDKYDREFLSIVTEGITQNEMNAHLSIIKKIANNLKSME